MPRDLETLESIARLSRIPHWERLKEEALKKVEAHERSVSNVLFRTRSPVDPLEIEFARGFRQGVMYVLDGLPNSAIRELLLRIEQMDEEDNKEVD